MSICKSDQPFAMRRIFDDQVGVTDYEIECGTRRARDRREVLAQS